MRWGLNCCQLQMKTQYFQAPEVLFRGFNNTTGDLGSDGGSAAEGQNGRNVVGDAAK